MGSAGSWMAPRGALDARQELEKRKTPANPGPAVVSWLSMQISLTQVYSVGFISRKGLRGNPTPGTLAVCEEEATLCPLSACFH